MTETFTTFVSSAPAASLPLGSVAQIIPVIEGGLTRQAPASAMGGGWQNSHIDKTGAYVVANVDKGSTISLSGNAFYTLTFGPLANYDENFIVAVINRDTGRGKKIIITGGPTFILWPLQSVLIFNGVVWGVMGRNRWLLPGSQGFFCDPVNGDDSNDGLAIGAGNAWKTFQGVFANVGTQLDFANNTVSVNFAHGTYSPLFTESVGWQGAGDLLLIGDPVAPSSVVIDGGAASALLIAGTPSGPITLNGFHVQSSGNSGVVVGEHIVVNLLNMEFGNVAYAHVVCGSGADLEFQQAYRVVGNAVIHKACSQGGSLIRDTGAVVATIVGNPVISIWDFAAENSSIEEQNTTIVGAPADGCAQFVLTLNGVLNTNSKVVKATAITGAVWASTGGGQTTLTLAAPISATAGNPINVVDVLSSGGSGAGFNRNYVVATTVVSGTTLVLSDPRGSSPGTYSSGGVVGYPVGTVQGVTATGGQFS